MGRYPLIVLTWAGAALAVGLAVPTGAQCQTLRPVPSPRSLVPQAIPTLPITAPEIPGTATLKLRDPASGKDISWLTLPTRDMEPLVVLLPTTPRVALTVTDVRTQIAAPLNRLAAFGDPRMRLTVAPDAIRTSAARSLAEYAALATRQVPGTRAGPPSTLLDAVLRPDLPTAELQRTFRAASGMEFAAFKRDIEQPEVRITVRQTYAGVPVEHVGFTVWGKKPDGARTISGSLIRRWRIVGGQPPAKDPSRVVAAAYLALKSQTSVERDDRDEHRQSTDKPQLVLLPDGNAGSKYIALHYAWRLHLQGRVGTTNVPFIAWLDARTEQLIKLIPYYAEVAATGMAWRRDPGAGAPGAINFEVNPAIAGNYTLSLAKFSSIPQVLHSDCIDANTGANTCEVSVSTTAQSSASTVNFDQEPFNDASKALCKKGGNRYFQQVSLFAQLYDYRERSYAYGTGASKPLPIGAWGPLIEVPGFCSAESGMVFGACDGYYKDDCPNYNDESQPKGENNRMNFAHDNTAVAHEFGHAAMANLWANAPLSIGWQSLHDLADAWAADFENTNCIAGWAAKNIGGPDAAKNCSGSFGHAEGSDLPRLLEVSFPFLPMIPGNHFPEHRDIAGDLYGDMQIASTALWLLRDAMRGKLGIAGQTIYVKRFSSALAESGALGADPGSTDRGVFTRMWDLERNLIAKFAADTTANKVLASFAKVGIFPVSPDCLDADSGCAGGAAVVDVDDNDTSDDVLPDGTLATDSDYIRRDGPKPIFHVWTGPRFRFDSAQSARPLADQAPCNAQFKIELSVAPDFKPQSALLSTIWLPVVTDALNNPEDACYAKWMPSDVDWATMRAKVSASNPVTIYYRVLTRDANDGNEKSSLLPTPGMKIAAPFAVINMTGSSGL